MLKEIILTSLEGEEMKRFLSAERWAADWSLANQKLTHYSFCLPFFIFRPLSSCKCATSTLCARKRLARQRFHFYYSFGMKLHPRVLGADRGNFTAAVGKCKRVETPQMGCRWRCSAGRNCSSGDERMSLNISVTDGGRNHENFSSPWWNTCQSGAASERDVGCNYEVWVNITVIIWLWLSSFCRGSARKQMLYQRFHFQDLHRPPQWDAHKNKHLFALQVF